MNDSRARKAQEKLIAALLIHNTFDEAAKAAGISAATCWRWRKDPEFQERYREAKERMLAGAVHALHNSALVFATTLRDVCLDSNANANAKATAARHGLEALLKISEHTEILRRLDALETTLSQTSS